MARGVSSWAKRSRPARSVLCSQKPSDDKLKALHKLGWFVHSDGTCAAQPLSTLTCEQNSSSLLALVVKEALIAHGTMAERRRPPPWQKFRRLKYGEAVGVLKTHPDVLKYLYLHNAHGW